MNEFLEPGDVVKLKSGGPKMTVSSVDAPYVNVEYFDDNGGYRNLSILATSLQKLDY